MAAAFPCGIWVCGRASAGVPMQQRVPLRWPGIGLVGCLLVGATAVAVDTAVPLPHAIPLSLAGGLQGAAQEGRLQAVLGETRVPAQFVADTPGSTQGVCLFLAPGELPSGVTFAAAAEAPPPGLEVTRDEAGQLLIQDGGQPVLRYNVQTVPVPAGIEGPYAVARSDYIHPLFGLCGEVLTQDYAKDHPHHRGIYWAWPEVTWKGVMHDLHALQGVFARPEARVRAEGGTVAAVVEAANVWAWEDREPIVREIVQIRAFRATGGLRCIDLHLRFEALQPGVTLARRHQDAYGGLSLRFSPRAGQVITRRRGPMRFPLPECWGELVGTPPGGAGPVGVAMLPHPGNPSYPEDWIDYPELNWLQPAFPAVGTAFALEPGQPLVLRYRLVVRHGAGLQADLQALWRNAGEDWQPFAAAAGYRFGQQTTPLRAWEQRLRGCPPEDWPALETALLLLLSAPGSGPDLQRWVCDQLKCYGSVVAVPALVARLNETVLAAAAADALETLPGPAVDAALRQALVGLPPVRQPQGISLLGARRDAEAVPLLAPLALGGTAEVSETAAAALGAIGTAAAGEALLQCLVARPASVPLADAALACARTLGAGPEGQRAQGTALLRAVLAQAPAGHQRQAALAQLAAAAPTEALATSLQWLAQGAARERRGAALVLQALPAGDITPALVKALPSLSEDAALVAIEVLSTRPDAAVTPALRSRLGDSPCGAAAARLLGQVGGAESVPALASLALSRSEAGEAARVALLSLPGAAVDGALRDLVQSPEPTLRRLAAELLPGRLGAASLPEMLTLARDPETAVSRRALDTLGDLGDAAVVPSVVALLPALPAGRRGDALGALAQIARRGAGADPVVEAILTVSRPDPGLQAEVVGSLHGFPCAAAAGALKEALAGTDAGLREAAGRALLKWPVTPPADLIEAVKTALAAMPDGPLRPVLEKALANLTLLALRNLCQGRPVVSSHPWQGSWAPEMAVDGIIATTSYWSCAESPSALTVDLGEPLPIAAVRVVNYWDGTRYYQYTVAISEAGTTWTTVADMSQNTVPATEAGALHRVDLQNARYVRVTMLHNSANPGMHVAELQAFSRLPQQE